MARCAQSVEEFIQDAFAPAVAVLCSGEAERLCRKNDLSFSELLRPFCRLTSEGHIRDPNNQVHVVKNLRICVSDIAAAGAAGAAAAAAPRRRLLSEVVQSTQPQEGAAAGAMTAGDYEISFGVTTPWFEAYRENFLQSTPVSEHEFLNHHLACLLVASSSEPSPVDQFQQLSQEQHRVQHGGDVPLPRWFTPNTLKYYVLLHDVADGDEPRADAAYEDMKQRYGAQGCHLLKINSRPASERGAEQIPDPWSQYLQRRGQDPEDGGGPAEAELPPEEGAADAEAAKAPAGGNHGACLTLIDHDRIRQFVQEFTFRGLLPHIEKNIRQLNDQLVSRKGLSRSLFTATKKWFGGGKIPEKGGAEPKSASGVLYPPEAPELQIRKMADLCFLVQHYELAYSCYHTAKKDFLSDQAMLYAAGALEMAAVAAFLQAGASRPYPAHYMDTAIQTYRDVCRNGVLAERCALLSADILKSQGKFSEAATLLIKMTSEDCDLRSALLLEQAAHCFVNMRTPMVRKFSFHMILAGHRFSKAGQRRHALRCYLQALQVYRGRGWALAEDHINFTVGRQSFTLGRAEPAAAAFRLVLSNDSRQTAAQQGAFLREFLFVHQSAAPGPPDELPLLPLPHIQTPAVRVYFGHERRPAQGEKQAATHVSLDQELDHEQAAMWARLEERLLAAAHGGALPAGFQPTQSCLDQHTDNQRPPQAVVNEPVVVELAFRNPLKVPLALSNLSLLWTFQANDATTDEDSEAVTPQTIQEFLLNPEETKTTRLKLLPRRTGQMKVTGVAYELAAAAAAPCAEASQPEPLRALAVRGRQDLHIRGPRLNLTKEDKMSVRHGVDRRLEPVITAPMPLMEVFFLDFPTALLCGEVRRTTVEFGNVGAVALCGLRVASTHPDFFAFESRGSGPGPGTEQDPVPIDGGVLRPGQSVQLPLWLRGPDQEGVHEIHFLFYYQSAESGLKVSHRVLRHTAFICAGRSLSVRASARRSGGGGALVFMDVENIAASDGGPRQFHILQVSSSSRRWRLHQRINPTADCKLASRERAKLCFRAAPCPRSEGDGERERPVVADLDLGVGRVKAAFPLLPRRAGAGGTRDELDLTVVVMWKALAVEDGRDVVLEGQLHVALQALGQDAVSPPPKDEAAAEMLLLKFRAEPGPAAAPPPSPPPAEPAPLVKTSLEHPENFSHAFRRSSLCVVPVALTLSNCCSDPVDVDVDLTNSSDVHSCFSWVGKSRLAVRLRPREVRSVGLRACFPRAGVYNLNTPRVSAWAAGTAGRRAAPAAAAGPALIVIGCA
ncbi:trafficking protein particle complex subunit 8 isoform X2 [Salarias fasciatus]|uniref:trafficking protein particle complex subunit 8 isoform X2 n=1 Tax=Salarias fasciatus TaxID=181472 RepID=UPI001176ACEC|nr:trafficking protein particle complex subunit 8 isoform X2 [Salarias fasciatus]